jgi:hypothetical protein
MSRRFCETWVLAQASPLSFNHFVSRAQRGTCFFFALTPFLCASVSLGRCCLFSRLINPQIVRRFASPVVTSPHLLDQIRFRQLAQNLVIKNEQLGMGPPRNVS